MFFLSSIAWKEKFQNTKFIISLEIIRQSKTWQAYCTEKSTPAGVYFDVAMATHLVPDLYYAKMIIFLSLSFTKHCLLP